MDIEEIEKGLKGLDQIEEMVNHQRKILNDMLGVGDIEASLTQEIITAIDKHIADKTIVYRKDEESNETQTILKVINSETDESVIVRITSLDWI